MIQALTLFLLATLPATASRSMTLFQTVERLHSLETCTSRSNLTELFKYQESAVQYSMESSKAAPTRANSKAPALLFHRSVQLGACLVVPSFLGLFGHLRGTL